MNLVYSLGCMVLTGMVFATVCEKAKLPRIVGYLLAGIVLGPFVGNQIGETTLAVSGDVRKIALIVILLKAGFSLNLEDLKKVGRSAVCMSFLPATCEMIGYAVLATKIVGCSVLEACIIGSVLAAVSPAVVVPRMVRLMEEGYGTKKGIPQMILAGSSCDDIFVIVVFTSFVNMAQGGNVQIQDFIQIPVSIVLGVALGIVVGIFMQKVFCSVFKETTVQVILVLAVSCLLVIVEDYVPVSGLLAVIAMACTLHKKMDTEPIAKAYGEIWKFAEILLFVLVGAAVDIRYLGTVGVRAVLLVLLALVFRAVGVCLSVMKSGLNKKEKLFCVLAYIPKATVQAAIGSVPLSMGLSCGSLVLSIAVTGILITAPLGAFLIDSSYRHLLTKEY